jgi:hypothetical protein
VELSFWNSWPEVSVELHGISALTTEANMARHHFRRRNLLEANMLSFKLDLLSFFTNHYEVKRIVLEDPVVYAEANRQEHWNWEVMLAPALKPDTTQPDTANLHFALRRFVLQNADIRVVQPTQHLVMDAKQLDLELAGDFAADEFRLEAQLACRMDTLAHNRNRLVSHRNLRFEGALDVKSGQGKYRLEGAKLWVEEIFLALHGQVLAPGRGQGLHLDLAFASGKSDYRRVLSLLPAYLTTDLRSLEVGGHFQVEGTLVGPINRTQSPTLQVDYRVWEGSLASAAPPASITGLAFHGQLEWNANKPELARITLDSIRGHLGEDAFTGAFSYRNFADPSIQLVVNGEFDLALLSRLWPEAFAQYMLEGRVLANFQTQGRLADFRGVGLQRTQSQGTLSVQRLNLAIAGLPRPLRNLTGQLQFTPSALQAQNVTGLWGAAPLQFSGQINGLVPFLFEDNARLGLNIQLSIDSVNTNEFAIPNPTTPASNHMPAATPTESLSRLDFAATVAVKHLQVAQLEASNVRASITYAQRTLNITSLILKALGGTAQFSGMLGPNQWQGNVGIEGMDIHRFFQAFPEFGDLLLVGQNAYGFLTTRFTFPGRPLPDMTLDAATLTMAGDASVAEGKIRDFKVLEEMSSFIKLRQFRNIDFVACSTGFSIQNQKVTIAGMYLKANGYQLWADGTHGFDQTLDYQLKIEMPRREWQESQNAEVRQWVETVESGTREGMKLFIRITGTVDNPRFQLDRQELRNEIRRDFQREARELEAEARQERERIFGNQSTENANDWIQEQPRERRPLIPRRPRDTTRTRRN